MMVRTSSGVGSDGPGLPQCQVVMAADFLAGMAGETRQVATGRLVCQHELRRASPGHRSCHALCTCCIGGAAIS